MDRVCAFAVSKICSKFAESLIISDCAIRGVKPLKIAVDKIVGADRNMLTPVHTAFALISLKAMCFDYATQVLDIPIFSVDPKAFNLTSLDYLSYFYYAGMIYTGLKRFSKALECFKLVNALFVPTISLLPLTELIDYQDMSLISVYICVYLLVCARR